MTKERKPLYWVGSSREDLSAFPADVKLEAGYALHVAQTGGRHPDAKPLKGFGGAGVLEVVTSYDGEAYRIIYTVTFPEAVYALHAFQKKSKSGIKTPKKEIDLVERRLEAARRNYELTFGNAAKKAAMSKKASRKSPKPRRGAKR